MIRFENSFIGIHPCCTHTTGVGRPAGRPGTTPASAPGMGRPSAASVQRPFGASFAVIAIRVERHTINENRATILRDNGGNSALGNAATDKLGRP